MTPSLILWSGGKDSALALHEARQQFDIITLVTTVTESYDRISMHGVRVSFLERQAAALGYPLHKVLIPPACSNALYEERMDDALRPYLDRGIRDVICGDLFLEDIRRYREQQLARLGLTPHFPLWGQNTTAVAHRFIDLGYRAVLCCVDGQQLDGDFAGRLYDAALLNDLPSTVDPCGENGEFHTFVFDGPLFANPIPFTPGERVLRDERFWFRDMVPLG